MNVFLLTHTHEFDDGHEDVKIIGLYSTRASAEAARDLLRAKPGFERVPDGWHIEEHDVDPSRPSWEEGFHTFETIFIPSSKDGVESLRPVKAWHERGDRYTIAEGHAHAQGEVWRFREGETVLCREHVFADKSKCLAAYERAAV